MQLILTQTTIADQSYWLGSTVHGLAFVGRENGPADEWQAFFPAATTIHDQQANQAAIKQLRAYLAGNQSSFDLTLDQSYGTALQQQVWQTLSTIPYGDTTTYTAIATKINRPTAVRAVASAVGKNPLLIIIPCHRVLRKDGSLGGYRGGLPMKRALLDLEKSGSTCHA